MSRQYVSVHFDHEEQLPAAIRAGVTGEKPYLVLDINNINFYVQHWQLLDLRDKITAALAISPQKCHFDGCEEEHDNKQCLSCDRKGCDEHMAAVFCGPESAEIDGYACSPECPKKQEIAA